MERRRGQVQPEHMLPPPPPMHQIRHWPGSQDSSPQHRQQPHNSQEEAAHRLPTQQQQSSRPRAKSQSRPPTWQSSQSQGPYEYDAEVSVDVEQPRSTPLPPMPENSPQAAQQRAPRQTSRMWPTEEAPPDASSSSQPAQSRMWPILAPPSTSQAQDASRSRSVQQTGQWPLQRSMTPDQRSASPPARDAGGQSLAGRSAPAEYIAGLARAGSAHELRQGPSLSPGPPTSSASLGSPQACQPPLETPRIGPGASAAGVTDWGHHDMRHGLPGLGSIGSCAP